MKELDWTNIYEKQSGKLLASLSRYVTDIETAEDILHESFIKAMQSAHTFQSTGALEAWLKQITINTALDYIRKNKNLSFVDIEELQIADEATQTSQAKDSKSIIYNSSFSRDELLEIINSLPVQQKTIFNLYVIDGFSHKEIAETLNINESLSKTTLSRTRKKVQSLLLEKALNKEKKYNKRRGVIAVLSTAIAGETFADNIFKQAFKNDFFTAKMASDVIGKNTQNAQPLVIKSTIKILKSASIIAGGTAVTASITLGVVAYNSSEKENRITLPQTKEAITKIEVKQSSDSLLQDVDFGTNSKPQILSTTHKVDSTKSQKVTNNSITQNSADSSLLKSKDIVQDSLLTASANPKKIVVLKKKVFIKQ